MAGEDLRLEHRPELTRPVLVASFRGCNDGAQGASKASAFLSRLWHAQQFAEIDPEQFFDFQSTRPHVSLSEGKVRRMRWPQHSLQHGSHAPSDRALVLRAGAEPQLR